MKSFKMRYFFIAPMVVLAIVACAKRDSDFAKRAEDARNAANKTTPPTSPTPSPTTDLKAPSPAPADPANPTTDTSEDQDGTKDLYKESCKNPIVMEVQEDETELAIDDLVSKEKSSYILQSSEFYVDHAVKDAKENSLPKNQLHVTGSQYELPKDFDKTATDENKILVICHTVKADKTSTQKMSDNFILPYEISAADGSVTVLRQDKIDIDSKATIKKVSTLYSQKFSLKQLLADPQVKQSLIVKHSDGSIVIKLQLTNTEDKTDAFISATYTLKEPAKK
ncbi:MAG TPA: hypothetical protein VIG33_02335 [Pseudobdellovibrionaceae bacterium]|jgi:hypothetical protein